MFFKAFGKLQPRIMLDEMCEYGVSKSYLNILDDFSKAEKKMCEGTWHYFQL